jgi:isoleucyl-tRNA synthetase
LYVDITKDRMYCDAPDSPRRRATQGVMHTTFDYLTRLLAPILAFTADEAWAHFGRPNSVHLESLPKSDSKLIDPQAVADVDALLRARGVVAQALESARQQKQIGNNLEAHVKLALPLGDRVHRLDHDEVEEFLILSHLEIVTREGDPAATAAKTKRARCERCWRHRSTVGTIKSHPTLCDRCAAVIDQMAIEK